MARDVKLLESGFQEKVERLLANCECQGHILVPFYTERDVRLQAKLWRQSRTSLDIQRALTMLQREGAPWLAEVLAEVGPQFGRWATNALPGQSWHQHGEAFDCFVKNEYGKAVWSPSHQGYQVYGDEAKALGLNAGVFWPRKDAVHVQKRQRPVRSVYTWKDIDELMQEKFAN